MVAYPRAIAQDPISFSPNACADSAAGAARAPNETQQPYDTVKLHLLPPGDDAKVGVGNIGRMDGHVAGQSIIRPILGR